MDIVCRDKACDSLVFVEVKTRRNTDYGTPAESVGLEKQRLIARGAIAWQRMLDNPEVNYRFDIVAIVLTEEGPDIQIVKDAFALPAPYF